MALKERHMVQSELVSPGWSQAGEERNAGFQETESIAEQAVMYILSCKSEKLKSLKIGDLAVALGTDRIHLCREFELEQEMSIPHFIEREIVHRAVFIMEQEPDTSLSNLAKTLGFKDYVEFEKDFEKYLLIKPGRYKDLVKMRTNNFYHHEDLLHCHCSFL